MNNKKLLFPMILYILLLTQVKNANAVTTPTFGTCVNPQGTIKASYDSGTHGVAGDGSTFRGRDTVYTLSENTVMQCLCPENGQGIQTNWLSASTYTQEEISILVSQGWILIPDGSVWGLSNGQYLAKNNNYSCGLLRNTGGNSGSGGSINSNGGSVLAATAGQVLGLASTGNAPFIVSVFSLGLVILSLGLLLNRKKNRQQQV